MNFYKHVTKLIFFAGGDFFKVTKSPALRLGFFNQRPSLLSSCALPLIFSIAVVQVHPCSAYTFSGFSSLSLLTFKVSSFLLFLHVYHCLLVNFFGISFTLFLTQRLLILLLGWNFFISNSLFFSLKSFH